MKGRVRSARQAGKRGLGTVVVAGLAAGLALAETASARPQALTAPSECIGTMSGVPWHYKGRHGTAYAGLGVNGAFCTTSPKLVPSWTRGDGDLKPVPVGWHCSATLAGKLGECATSKGGIFEWRPKAQDVTDRPDRTPSNRRLKPKGHIVTRTIVTRMKATATLALACTTALVFAVATAQARPTRIAGSQSAAAALSDCTIVISGAPWRIRAGGSLSGDKYTLKARDVSCSSVRARVATFTHQAGLEFGAFKGPSGFKCKSFSTAASGNKLLYSGVCMRPPHNDPFFEWGPKVPGH